MITIRRKIPRKVTDLPVQLVLYNSTDDSTLSGPTPAFLHDISYHGAGLILPEIYFRPYHFFYEPHDNQKHILCLEKNRSEKDQPIIIPIYPIWFRVCDEEMAGYFRMGVNFMAPPEDNDIIDLEKLALESFKHRENLLSKLIRIFS